MTHFLIIILIIFSCSFVLSVSAAGESHSIEPNFVLFQTQRGDTSAVQPLFDLFKNVKCERHHITRHCIPGTVQIDPWLKNVLDFQHRTVMQDLPLNLCSFAASHNAFNARADGYGSDDNLLRQVLRFFVKNETEDLIIAQQEYSMTDQLSFGIRVLHLDPQWFLHRMVLCHAGTAFPWFDKLVAIVESITKKHFEYSSEQLGCTASDRLWSAGMEEISAWLRRPGNDQEIVLLYINDRPHWSWNHTEFVLQPMLSAFGSKIFKPLEKSALFPNQWPSLRELSQLGKQIVLVGSEEYSTYGGKYVFPPLWTGYPDKNANRFTPFPNCGGRSFTRDWTCWSGESQVLGPFYNGPRDMGIIVPSTIQDYVDCGAQVIALDQASPPLLAKMVWTWDEASREPQRPVEQPCVFLSLKTLRWHTTKCSGPSSVPLAFACQSKRSPHEDWTISEAISSDIRNGTTSCPQGYSFAVPRSPYHVKLLKDKMVQRVVSIWLNIGFDAAQQHWIINPL